MPLDLSSLKKAVTSLENTLNVAENPEFMEKLNDIQRNAFKSGVVQNFEFTYELSWKFIQRWIRLNKTPEDAEPRTRKDLFRIAARFGLIKDPLPWFKYAEARNMVSHTYDQEKADEVFNAATEFIHDAKHLLSQLEALND